jgi:hypothetical protein
MRVTRPYKNSIGTALALASLCGAGLLGGGYGFSDPFRVATKPAPPQPEPLNKFDEWFLEEAKAKRARKALRKSRNEQYSKHSV